MMTIISGAKGTGKTRRLLELASFNKGVVVCEDPEVMRHRAHKCGITGLYIISYEEYVSGEFSQPVFIHDVTKFVSKLSPDVRGYSICI